MVSSGQSRVMDRFFSIGGKVTNNDPVRKAYFDYCLYWVVFLTFVGLGINYLYQYFFNNSTMSSLLWGVIVLIFSWFNYWALLAFRGAYLNMKKFYSKPKQLETQDDKKEFEEMFNQKD